LLLSEAPRLAALDRYGILMTLVALRRTRAEPDETHHGNSGSEHIFLQNLASTFSARPTWYRRSLRGECRMHGADC
jgi:hypothetical protein